MHIFEYILIMLVAILASSFIGARFPKLPTPLVQIAAGVALTLLPLDFAVHLEPELFMVLFIAPLLFDDAKKMDKPSLWRYKTPILLLALGLVICTVLAIGFAVNLFTPSIPLAAAFALGAALAPTDAVSVNSIKQNAKITDSQSKLLQGESLLNDASSIVSFNFAILAAVTGTFSLLDAEGSFLLKFIGGLALGVVLMLIRSALLRFMRARGIDSVSFYVLFEVITPLLVYLFAEIIGVSGIIAVVAAGIAHSFSPRVVTPTYARLNVVSGSVWSVITFTLNGLVFLMLGTQLPYVAERVWTGTTADTNYLILFIVLILVVSLVLRFIWVLIMRRNVNLGRIDEEPAVKETAVSREDLDGEVDGITSPNTWALEAQEQEVSVEDLMASERQASREARAQRRKARREARIADKKAARADEHYWKLHLLDALVLSLAGVKGAISLAIILSVPMTLGGAEPFPERDLLIFLTSGVILLSLLTANIVLPLISPKRAQATYEEAELKAILNIYRKVIADLDAGATASERPVVGEVIREYYLRISSLKKNNSIELPCETNVRHYAVELELENTQRLFDEGKISNLISLFYINSLSQQMARIEHHNALRWELKSMWHQVKHSWSMRKKLHAMSKEDDVDKDRRTLRYEVQTLQLENYRYIVSKFKELEPTEDMPAHTVALVRSEYEQRVHRFEARRSSDRSLSRQRQEAERIAIEARALDLERQAISEAHNDGLITNETAKMLRDNVAMMELDIEDQLED